MPDELRQQYDALTLRAGFSLLARSQVVVSGKDRVRLLHGLCTNDIRTLQAGEGCQAFLTDAQGHTIGYVDVFRSPHHLIVDSAPAEAGTIISNLDRYVIREEVRFEDKSEQWVELLVSGAAATDLVGAMLRVDIPAVWGAHQETSFRDSVVWVRRTSYAGPTCLQLSADRPLLTALSDALQAAGVLPCEAAVVETLRIEAGTPVFGQDISADNLPQEVDRVERTISFTKGCYLGQETVARIDSLGHVNRVLRQLRFGGSELPPIGGEIQRDGKVAARITSACFSPRLQAPLALAYVRRGSHQPGTRLSSPWGEAEVLPKGEP